MADGTSLPETYDIAPTCLLQLFQVDTKKLF